MPVQREGIVRRTMTLFFVIDASGSMAGAKIGSVNESIENVLPMIDDISINNPDAEIKVAALEFSTDTRWLYNEPKSAKEFIWQPVEAEVLTSLGAACKELESKLHKSNGGFMSSPSGCYAPVIILLSDGEPTDNYQEGLSVLQNNNWFKNAIKIAIAIGDDANTEVLKEFTGSIERVITVHTIDALKKMIEIIAVTSSQIGSSSSTADKDKQDKVIDQISDVVDSTSGVNDNTPDEWD